MEPKEPEGQRKEPENLAGAAEAGELVAALRAGERGDALARAVVERLREEARDFARDAKAYNTLRAYASDWRDFTDWCQWHRREPLPASPETVALYLTHLARAMKPSTIQRRISSISQAHAAAGFDESPTRTAIVRAVWQGIRRSKGVAQVGKTPVLTPDLREMIAHLPGGKLLSLRDRALLLIGFAGAMRRSELVGLDVEDVAETAEGLVVTIRRSKTDQEGAGRKVGIPYGSKLATCPVRAVREWKAASGLSSGPLFRPVNRHGRVLDSRLGDRSVALVVKRAIGAAGREPEGFAGHSLRAGLATAAAMAGVSERAIQEQTGHKSLPMLRKYIRDGSLFRENAAAEVGL